VFVGGDFVSKINHHASHHSAMENGDYKKYVISHAFLVQIPTCHQNIIILTMSASNSFLFPFPFPFPGSSFNLGDFIWGLGWVRILTNTHSISKKKVITGTNVQLLCAFSKHIIAL